LSYFRKEDEMDITGIGSIADLAKGVMDKFWPPEADPTERLKAEMVLQKVIESRERSVVDAQKGIIVAEMEQGDNYTKRARPTIVYAGLAFIFMVYVVLPMVSFFKGTEMPVLNLPTEFWWAWTGVCGIWVVGRTMEKKGGAGKIISLITGK